MKKALKRQLYIQYVELAVLLGYDISQLLFIPYSKIDAVKLSEHVKNMKEMYLHINGEEYTKHIETNF